MPDGPLITAKNRDVFTGWVTVGFDAAIVIVDATGPMVSESLAGETVRPIFFAFKCVCAITRK